MTRRRTVIVPPADVRERARADDGTELADLPVGAFGAAPLSPTEERRERELEDILGEVGNDGRIKVWQVLDGKASYAGEMGTDVFSLDTLLETFGGGDKSLVIYQGRTKVDTVRVSLDPSIPPRNPRMPKTIAGAPPPGTAPADMMQMMATAMTAIMSGVGAIMANSNRPQTTDPMLVELVRGLANRPERDPTAMALELAKLLKPDPATSDMAFKSFERGMSVMERLGGKGEDDGVMGVVGDGMKILGGLVDGIVTEKKANAARFLAAAPNGGARTSGARRVPDSNGAGKGDVGERGTDDAGAGSVAARGETGDVLGNGNGDGSMTDRLWVRVARPHIGTLLSLAKFLSPDAAADTIDRNLPDGAWDDLLTDIYDQTGDGFGPRLLQYFPDSAMVDPEWLAAVVAALVREEPDAGDETDAIVPGIA